MKIIIGGALMLVAFVTLTSAEEDGSKESTNETFKFISSFDDDDENSNDKSLKTDKDDTGASNAKDETSGNPNQLRIFSQIFNTTSSNKTTNSSISSLSSGISGILETISTALGSLSGAGTGSQQVSSTSGANATNSTGNPVVPPGKVSPTTGDEGAGESTPSENRPGILGAIPSLAGLPKPAGKPSDFNATFQPCLAGGTTGNAKTLSSIPSLPGLPTLPLEGVTTSMPSGSNATSLPSIPSLPDIPSSLPGVPSQTGGTTAMPSESNATSLPSIPSLTNITSLPGLPSLSGGITSMSAESNSTSLTSIPSLPNIPSLPIPTTSSNMDGPKLADIKEE